MTAPGQTPLDNQTVSGILEQNRNQLMSLEVILRDARNRGRISRKEFRLRRHYLERVRARLLEYENTLAAWSAGRPGDRDLGMPDPDKMDATEFHICDHFAGVQLREARSLMGHLRSILADVLKASRGQTGPLAGIFCLSRYKKVKDALDLQEIGLKGERQQWDRAIGSLLGRLVKTGSADKAENISALMKVFQDVNILTRRITRLKLMVAREENLVSRMQNWLKQNQNRGNPTATPPPSPAAMEQAIATAQSQEFNPMATSASRTTLARQFVDQCRENNDPPESAAPPQPKDSGKGKARAN